MSDPDKEMAKCWELRSNCAMRGQSRENATCPAYRSGRSCWQVDWKSIVEALPTAQQAFWTSFLSNCGNCVVYRQHPEEMQSRIDGVRAIVFND